MSNANLTPVSYLVLGLVARGATTSYDLKQRVAKSIAYFWTFPHSQLYAEPSRLVQLGLLDEEQEQHGRRRRVYAVTEAGRAALADWLGEPTSEHPQLRDTALLKLFFGDVLVPGEVVALARAQEQSHHERLAVYEALDATIPHDGATEFPRAVLRMGLLCERAFIEFWSSIARDYAASS